MKICMKKLIKEKKLIFNIVIQKFNGYYTTNRAKVAHYQIHLE